MRETKKQVRCAIYTRKSSEEGLEQSFNSLHAQREACEAYILSQKHEGWICVPTLYDDGGFSGGNMERPGLKRLLGAIAEAKIDTVVVYKVDRLTRSLGDFARIVESFDRKGVSFVSVTQQFNTTTSMGRLTLNVLLSFAQFEREVTGERIRDKVAASKRKGMWMGGCTPLGYDLIEGRLQINEAEATNIREIFDRYGKLQSVTDLYEELLLKGIRSKVRISKEGVARGGAVLSRGTLYHLLGNPLYIGKIRHRETVFDGQHAAILSHAVWERTCALLAQNRIERQTSNNLPSGRILLGKLFDQDGKPFTPTHTNKKGRRYSYYTLRKLPGARTVGTVQRLPADQVEEAVLSGIRSLLRNALQLKEHFPDLEIPTTRLLIQASAHRAEQIAAGEGSVRSKFMSEVLVRTVFAHHQLTVELDRAALLADLIEPTDSGLPVSAEAITVRVPFEVKRRGNEVRLILCDGTSPRIPNPVLVRAVAQAKEWSQLILQGKARTARDLATHSGINENTVARIMPCAALSPQSVQRILEGDHDPALTLRQMTKKMPLDWRLQDQIFDPKSTSF